MSEQKPRKAKQFWPSAKRLVGLLAPYKFALTMVFLMNIAAVVLSVWAPKVTGKAMDVIFSGAISGRMPAGVSKEQTIADLRAAGQDRFADMAAAMDLRPGEGIDFAHLRDLILMILALYVFSSLFLWAQGAVLNRLCLRTVFQLRERVEAKLHRLPLHYYDSRQRGDVMSRTTNNIDNVQQALQQALSQIFNALITLVGIIAMMFVISWQLALVALLSIPLTALAMGVVGTRSQRQFAAQWKATGEVNGQVEEAFSGHEMALIFGRTDELHREFDERNSRLAVAAGKAQFLANSMHPLMQFISYLSYVAIAVFGGLRVASGHMTLGDATAFIQYSRQFNQPLGELAGMMQMVQSGVASAERIFELLDAEEEVADVRDDAASASESSFWSWAGLRVSLCPCVSCQLRSWHHAHRVSTGRRWGCGRKRYGRQPSRQTLRSHACLLTTRRAVTLPVSGTSSTQPTWCWASSLPPQLTSCVASTSRSSHRTLTPAITSS